MCSISRVTLRQIRVPLSKPYNLSFGSISTFDTILAEMEADGAVGWGESTPLPGYSTDTLEGVWTFSQRISDRLVGLPLEVARNTVLAEVGASGFECSALLGALDDLATWGGGEKAISEEETQQGIPLVGVVDSVQPPSARTQAEEAMAAGYRTVKIKAGLPGTTTKLTAEVIRAVRAAVGPSIQIRVDANQAYSLDEASSLLEPMEDCRIELFEQPMGKNDWDQMVELRARRETVPLMLDEPIVYAEDLDRCIRMGCADLVKFKIMKNFGPMNTLSLANRATAAGLGIVLGNGVQTEVGCIQEANLHRRMKLKTAGEQNGFLKAAASYLTNRIPFENGEMKACDLRIDRERLDRLTTRKTRFLHPSTN